MTVGSLLQQSVPDLRIIIACHEIPELDHRDERIDMYRVGYPPPKDYNEQMDDKYFKLKLGASKVKENGGGYIMFTDADDLVHRCLVEYVLGHDAPHGYVVRFGYEYYPDDGTIRFAPRFNRLCGSCYIIRFDAEELPSDIDDSNEAFEAIMAHGHYYREMNLNRMGRKLRTIPFPCVAYTVHPGGHSVATHNVGIKRKLLRMALPRVPVTKKFRSNFL